MTKTAIIIAGGQGKRLANVTKGEIPKPMVLVKGKPFIYWLIKYISSRGIIRIYLSLGYMGEKIQDYIHSEDFDGVEIFSTIEKTPFGTGGGVVNIIRQFNLDDKDLFVFNGDTLYLTDFIKIASKSMNNIQVWARQLKNDNQYGGLLFDDRHYLSDFAEKKTNSGFINAGVYFFPKDTFKDFKLESISMEYDIFPALLESNYDIKVNVDNCPFIDIGLPKTYANAEGFIEEYFNMING
jgi:D-glycero-alpha-D-manno-heptose 1-phosphate guanylyltransferase